MVFLKKRNFINENDSFNEGDNDEWIRVYNINSW